MSAKQTSWNEFSSAMASAVICLSTEDVLVAVLEDVNDEFIPSPALPTPPSQPSQDIPSTSQAQSPL
uniref:Uncharacterized protein n=1 Tax=Tanacetum cinerariifolium TaxID=118510 RepID=A0A699UUE3_TANCI|nr:hypothetical protein [Tanacetum cinerariifolium]